MKSHYRRSEFAPSIVVNKLSQGFNVFILGRSKYGWSLNKGSHIGCSEREAAAFPFALNTMNSLTIFRKRKTLCHGGTGKSCSYC